MNLWIRSQDKEKLICCNDIAIKSFLFNEIPKDEWSYSIVGYFDKETEYETLGSYETKERAIEVLDEIQKLLTPNFNVNGSYQEVDLILKSYLLNTQYGVIYEMPKE